MFFILPWKLRQKHSASQGGYPVANVALIALNVLVHLLLSMWALWVFGNPVNRRLGNGFYLLAYLGSIVTIGLLARFVLDGGLVGSSGALFAVIAMALLLMPAAALEVGCVALFPLTVVVGLLAKPKQAYQWIARWAVFSIPALWCLLLIPLMQLWSFFWSGWSWGPAAHLLGMMCGVAAVLMLPTRITMRRRSVADMV